MLYESCVRFISPSNFMLRTCARVRVCARVSIYRDLFFYFSTLARNNPPIFFQNANAGSVRVVDRRSCRNCRKYRTLRYGTILQHLLLIRLRHLSHTVHRPSRRNYILQINGACVGGARRKRYWLRSLKLRSGTDYLRFLRK